MTPDQIDVLRTLSRLENGDPDWPGALAGKLGPRLARCARNMERSGFIEIDRMAENCFRYKLTPKGRERARRAA